MKIRNTPTGYNFEIVGGQLLIEGDEGGFIHDEQFIANLEDKYTKAVRVVSMAEKVTVWHYIEGSGFEEFELNMQFTIRAENRGNFKRWDAYRRSNGKLKKVYVGKTEDITIERLIEVAKKL